MSDGAHSFPACLLQLALTQERAKLLEEQKAQFQAALRESKELSQAQLEREQFHRCSALTASFVPCHLCHGVQSSLMPSFLDEVPKPRQRAAYSSK